MRLAPLFNCCILPLRNQDAYDASEWFCCGQTSLQGLDEAQRIISIYVLALGIATPLAGVLADRFKLKLVYILGLCIFLGSLLSGLAPSFWLLVGARALQGIGGGIALPLSTVMLFTTFEDEEPPDRIEEKTIEPAKRAEA